MKKAFRMSHVVRSAVSRTVALALLLGATSVAGAAVSRRVVNNEANANCDFFLQWDWTFAAAAETASTPPGADWVLTLNTTAVNNGEKTLTVEIQHDVKCDALDARPGLLITLAQDHTPAAGKGAGKGIAKPHPNGVKHKDDVFVFVKYLADGAKHVITTEGRHKEPPQETPDPDAVAWSYLNHSASGSLNVDASYAAGFLPAGGGSLAQNERKSGALVSSGAEPPLGYRVTFQTSSGPSIQTDVTLAFLGINEDVPGPLPLRRFIEFMTFATFDAPALGTSGTPLYVGINLSTWAPFREPVLPGATFPFTNGRNFDLPGIVVGTSPVAFDAASGEFQTSSPFTGSATVVGTITGSQSAAPVPALGSWGALILSALLAVVMVFAFRVNQKRRRFA